MFVPLEYLKLSLIQDCFLKLEISLPNRVQISYNSFTLTTGAKLAFSLLLWIGACLRTIATDYVALRWAATMNQI
jgi:hypothetical protein